MSRRVVPGHSGVLLVVMSVLVLQHICPSTALRNPTSFSYISAFGQVLESTNIRHLHSLYTTENTENRRDLLASNPQLQARLEDADLHRGIQQMATDLQNDKSNLGTSSIEKLQAVLSAILSRHQLPSNIPASELFGSASAILKDSSETRLKAGISTKDGVEGYDGVVVGGGRVGEVRVAAAGEDANPFQRLEECMNDTELLVKALTSRKPWALEMLDAFGKPGPDLMGMNTQWLGAYDECRDVSVTPEMTSDNRGFSGRYCNAYIPVALEPGVNVTVMEGICVPDSCDPAEIEYLFNIYMILKLNSTLRVDQVTCRENKSSLDVSAIAALSVLGFLVLLVLVGTAVDLLLVQPRRWRRDDMLSIMMTGVDTKGERQPLLDSGRHDAKDEDIGRCIGLLTSFSLYSNVTKLLTSESGKDSLTCLHGVRFFSMIWVILGHSFWVPVLTLSWNYTGWLEAAMQKFQFQIIANAILAVDTFFLLSGLLVAYLSLRQLHKNQGRLNWLLFYFHRFWRLTPVYMLIIFVYFALWPYLASGPNWPDPWPDRDNCQTLWWTNLLYVNNIVDPTKMCFGHSWYLSNDMQFYILSPFIFFPLYHSTLLGLLVALLFLLASTVTPAVLTMTDHFQPAPLAMVDGMTQDSNNNWSADFYIKPYNRMAPYVIGLITGYIIFRVQGRLRMPKVLVLVGWAMAAAMTVSSLTGLYDATAHDPMPLWQSALYNGAGRVGWAVGVAWVIFACVTGNGGVVNSILSWGALAPLSRLTFCAYLLHLPVLYVTFFLRSTAFYITDLNVVMLFLGVLMLTYMLSAVVALVVEMPLAMVEKTLLQRDTGGKSGRVFHTQTRKDPKG